MKIYRTYMDPPEPPRHLWLTIDFAKIDFKDLEHIKFIYKCLYGLYTFKKYK